MSPTASGTLDVLHATLSDLWPGARTELTRARRADRTASAEFLLLPNSQSPRLLLPTEPRAAAASVMRFSAVAGPMEIAARTLASGALRAGATRLLPERIRVYADPTSDTQPLAEWLASALAVSSTRFSVSVGPARVNRKPVLQVFDPRGHSLGFAKLGDSDTSRAHVRAEAQALATLRSASFSSFRAPRVLHVGQWQEMFVLVQEDLAVGPSAVLHRDSSVPLAAMEELGAAFAAPATPMHQLAWWERCLRSADRSPHDSAAARLRAAMEVLATKSPLPVPVSAWHGDWTPWNMAPGQTVDGTPGLLVWDWERFETGVPAGMDPLHYAVNTATRTEAATPEVIRTALGTVGAVPRPRTPGFATGAAYLVAITARYLEMSSAPDGDLIIARAIATLETLESWVGIR